MDVTLRPGRPDDLAAIGAFTRETFPWGDYVPGEYPTWLGAPASTVIVAADAGDVPVGVGRAVLLSPREAWLHALRVHPEHRRAGVGSAILAELCRWAAREGALVARLLVEEWNDPSHALVRRAGFRPTAGWVSAQTEISVGGVVVDPRTNGGKRVPGDERLVHSPVSEVDPAWIAWSTSDLAVAARQLLPIGWSFRSLTHADIEEAARRRSLWHCPSGWVVADVDGDHGLFVPWLVTTDLDVDRLLRALLDWGRASGIERLRVATPDLAWMREALTKAGFTLSPGTVYARSPGTD